jgi:hypothetical protein
VIRPAGIALRVFDCENFICGKVYQALSYAAIVRI